MRQRNACRSGISREADAAAGRRGICNCSGFRNGQRASFAVYTAPTIAGWLPCLCRSGVSREADAAGCGRGTRNCTIAPVGQCSGFAAHAAATTGGWLGCLVGAASAAKLMLLAVAGERAIAQSLPVGQRGGFAAHAAPTTGGWLGCLVGAASAAKLMLLPVVAESAIAVVPATDSTLPSRLTPLLQQAGLHHVPGVAAALQYRCRQRFDDLVFIALQATHIARHAATGLACEQPRDLHRILCCRMLGLQQALHP